MTSLTSAPPPASSAHAAPGIDFEVFDPLELATEIRRLGQRFRRAVARPWAAAAD